MEMEKQTLILTKSKLNFKGSYLKDLGLFYLVEVVYHKKKDSVQCNSCTLCVLPVNVSHILSG